MEPQKTPNRHNPEKEKQTWSQQTSGFQTILQSCNNQNCMVLA